MPLAKLVIHGILKQQTKYENLTDRTPLLFLRPFEILVCPFSLGGGVKIGPLEEATATYQGAGFG